MIDLLRHAREFRRYLHNHQWERTDEGGILFPRARALARGMYVHDVNGQDERRDPNLLPTEALNHILDVTIGSTAKLSAWYLALYGSNVAPQAAWTAAGVAAAAGEITSGPEGYSESTRVAFTPAAAASGSKTNSASKAAFTIVTATNLSVYGCFMASASAKGATSGTLYSASQFAAVRSLANADVFNLGYTVSLTSS